MQYTNFTSEDNDAPIEVSPVEENNIHTTVEQLPSEETLLPQLTVELTEANGYSTTRQINPFFAEFGTSVVDQHESNLYDDLLSQVRKKVVYS